MAPHKRSQQKEERRGARAGNDTKVTGISKTHSYKNDLRMNAPMLNKKGGERPAVAANRSRTSMDMHNHQVVQPSPG